MKPVLYDINAFDPSEGTVLQFYWGGNQIVGNVAYIYKYDIDSKKYVVKYQYTYSSRMESTHPITQATQTASQGLLDVVSADNDFSYYATIKVIYVDSDGINRTSDESSMVAFRCYKKPTFRLTDYSGDVIEYGYTIRNSLVDVFIDYYQEANEPIKCFEIFLYNENDVLIQQSGNIYNLSTGFNITGLTNKKKYYLSAIGSTMYGTELSISKTMVYVNYESQDNYLTITSENNSWDGIIHLNAFLNANLCVLDTPDPNYELISNSMANLTNNGVLYDNSSGMGDKFQIYTKLYKPNANTTILSLFDLDGNRLCNVTYCENVQYQYALNALTKNSETYYLPAAIESYSTYGYFVLDTFHGTISTTPVLVSTNGVNSINNWVLRIYRDGTFYNIKEEHS